MNNILSNKVSSNRNTHKRSLRIDQLTEMWPVARRNPNIGVGSWEPRSHFRPGSCGSAFSNSMFTATAQKTTTRNKDNEPSIKMALLPVPHHLAHSPPPPPLLTPSATLCTWTLSFCRLLLRCLQVTPLLEPLSHPAFIVVTTISNHHLSHHSSRPTKT